MALSPAQFNRIKTLLYNKTGLYLKDSKLEFLSRRVASRMNALDIDSVGDYIRYVTLDPTDAELEYLIELVVINETYFFRDYSQLRLFGEETLPILLRERADAKRLRLLSAGCSTGDEAYTLAIILREVMDDFEQWNVQIEGLDISNKVLAIANKGVYTSHSLRETPYVYRDKYFESKGDSFFLKRLVKDMVTFRRANLMKESDMALSASVDVVV
jgi:chemotaxis protein methyltransferase CheR